MKTKILGLLILSMGILLFGSTAFASDTDLLQPASTITYNEDLTVNGTGRLDSVYIGKQGVGGVTFFNGTIINSTTGEEDSDNPVTFGDNVRIDGGIYRTQIGPPNAVRIWDSLEPGLTNANDLGSQDLEWKDLYLSGNMQGNDANFQGTLKVNDVEGLNDSDIPNNITASRYLLLTGGTINGSVVFQPQNYSGGIPLCGTSNYGMTMFSEISINGMGTNRLYTCDERGWIVIDNRLTATKSNAGGNLGGFGSYKEQVNVPGANVGNICSASLSTIGTRYVMISCNVSSSNTADVIIHNPTGVLIGGLTGGIMSVSVWK